MIVMDGSTSMVEVARYFMEFCKDESCGKCVPCRVGTVQLHRLLSKIQAGVATEADLAQLRELCTLVKETSLCGLGQSAPNPVLSTLRYFPEEYAGLLRGEVGSHVHITVERGGAADGGVPDAAIEAGAGTIEELEIERAPYARD